jgi:hypoxanthine phosphoribosyltransferase
MQTKDIHIESILFHKETITRRIEKLAKVIDNDYLGKNPILIGILKGCVPFYNELFLNLTCNPIMDFMLVASYGDSDKSNNKPKILLNYKQNITNRHVLIVEDCVDTGNTLARIIEAMKKEKPASIKIACLLDKPACRKKSVNIDYLCFKTGPHFVVGHGFDYKEQFRNLPYIGILKKKYIK